MTDPALAAELISGHAPKVAIILGSGLGGFAARIADATTLAYDALPGFPAAGVAGHAGRLTLGRIAGRRVACLEGRSHVYEGRGFDAMAVPIRALKLAGVTRLIVTNAAGSLRPEVGPGRLVALSDHINFMPGNPLTGPNDERFGPRFPSLRDVYDPALRRLLAEAAKAEGIDLAEGVYLGYAGPNFETAAEIRAFRILGADLVGMSTVPEVILARHCGLRVAALSVVTNLAEGMAGGSELSHDQTLAAAARASGDLERLLLRFIEMAP